MGNLGGVYSWSQVAASNASADTTVNWSPQMAPSAVGPSGRAMMASVAKYRDDIAGAIVTGGSLNAYTVSSFQQFDTLADMNGQQVWFTPHVTNGATVTLNVDSLGSKPLRSAPNTELLAGVLIQGTPYGATYNNADGVWYLKGFYGNPYNIPLGAGLDYWGSTTPNSTFAFPTGQAISRTTYAGLFALFGTTYGTGDGTTTFNLPDKTGRVSAMKEAAASRLTSTYFGGNSANLGATGGNESHTLSQAEMPSHSHTATSTDSGHTHNLNGFWLNEFAGGTGGGGSTPGFSQNPVTTSGNANITTTVNNTGGGGAHNIVQPTIVCNYIIRVL